jgi:SAM-dependent methyltransferase
VASTWNHNTHYTPWILERALVTQPMTALDVGSGDGLLASKLAAVIPAVTGIDSDDRQTARSAARYPEVTFVTGDVLTAELGQYDLVTCVATLHHLPLASGLESLRDRVSPGGTLIVVGLARENTPGGIALGVITITASKIVRLWRGWYEHGAPMMDAVDTTSGRQTPIQRGTSGTTRMPRIRCPMLPLAVRMNTYCRTAKAPRIAKGSALKKRYPTRLASAQSIAIAASRRPRRATERGPSAGSPRRLPGQSVEASAASDMY